MAGLFGRGKRPGDLDEEWPKDAQGEPIVPKFLTHCRCNDYEDTVLVSMLSSYGIPVMVRYPGDGGFGKVVLGMSGTGSSLYVPETMYDEAKQLMEAKPDDDLQEGI